MRQSMSHISKKYAQKTIGANAVHFYAKVLQSIAVLIFLRKGQSGDCYIQFYKIPF